MSIFGDLINVGITIVEDRLKIGTKPGQYPELQLEVEMEVTGSKGDLGYISSYDATTKRPTFSLADANALGKIATHALLKGASAGAKGRVVSMGIITGTASQVLDTNAFSVGDQVFLTATSTTTNTWGVIPTGIDDVVMAVGVVIVVSATVGQIYFYPGMSVPQTYGNIAIPDASITLAKMAVESIDSDQYVDGSIDTIHMSMNSIDSDQYIDGSIDTVHLADNQITSDKVEVGLLQTQVTQLTNDQVKALVGTPITIVDAPGANLATIVHKIFFVADGSAGAWSETTDDMVVEYADGTDITGAIESTNFMDQTDVEYRTYGVLDTELIPDVDAVVRLLNTSGNFTGGNASNTLSVKVWYSVVPTVAFS